MKILFDQGTPAPLRRHLAGYSVDTAYERGWSNLSNGDLLEAAEREGYQLFLTTDQNLRYQQNLAGRQLAIIVLLSTSWPRIRQRVEDIKAAVDAMPLVNTKRFQFEECVGNSTLDFSEIFLHILAIIPFDKTYPQLIERFQRCVLIR